MSNGNRVCGRCKHFVTEAPGVGGSHCRLNPPVTTAFYLGTNEKGPVIHTYVAYPITRPEFWCSHWTIRIELASSIGDPRLA